LVVVKLIEIWVFLIILVVSLLSAFGGFYLKLGSKKFKLSFKSLKNKFLIIGVLFNIFSLGLYIYVLRFEELSTLFPFIALNYVWVSVMSKYFLKEKINLIKLIGIVFIIIGVSLIGFS